MQKKTCPIPIHKATPKWFETAKENHGKAWVTHVKKQAGGS